MEQVNGLQNKRVVILGGSSGIGLAVAEQAISQGAEIVIASSNPERIQKATEPFGANAQGTRLTSRTNRLSKLFLRSVALRNWA